VATALHSERDIVRNDVPLVLSLKVKEQVEGVTAIWCKCSSFFWGGCLEGCCAVHTYPATNLIQISIPLAIQRSIRAVIDLDTSWYSLVLCLLI
jgi:hypothetical protein